MAHERSLGLTPKAKLIGQFLIAAVFVLVAVNLLGIKPTVEIPFVATLDLGVLTTVVPVGDGIAIPHSKSEGVSKTSLAVARIPEAVEWPSLDDGPCRAFVMFAVRSDDQNQEVHLLSKVAVALCHKEVVETLLTSDDPKTIRCALSGEESNE